MAFFLPCANRVVGLQAGKDQLVSHVISQRRHAYILLEDIAVM